ncbi:Uncharacterized ATP-dependent helicase MG140 [Seminavis robusta]|uniref:Uncharacterized ATP-dependent helicase MG140 n=1 Tax=Seminavis robusta TaxID=568900 RepID=A0A9N8DCU0_9STRA|nr:Uncharacterized ATP-dependent helicase MG140 [Seminavis robusta]|eukprot:Sro94_g048940.1 Uncharacterized ATP-dependent helicase MG140 (1653) ;mRNA; r:41293-46570
MSSDSLTGWIFGSIGIGGNRGSNDNKDNRKDNQSENPGSEESDEVRHRKQLAQILRYIATMHHSLGSSSSDNKRGHSFLKRSSNLQRCWQSSFYQEFRGTSDEERRWGILFTTQNFKTLQRIQAESATQLFESPPFSFYAATSSGQSPTANRKRAWADAFRTVGQQNSTPQQQQDGKACWLRLTRLTTAEVPEPPSFSNPAVRRYLEQWRESEFQHCRSFRDMITLQTIEQAPKVSPADLTSVATIKTFLRAYKRYLRKRAFQQALEPIYNQLFEWVQQTQHHDTELVWGLGHARMIAADQTVVNGPICEVLVEVELSRDGALLVRPREHTGVALNREVVTALMNLSADDASVNSAGSASTAASANQRLTQMHRSVAELDPLQMSPGQPSTYVPLLKRMVMELSSGGSFQMTTKLSENADRQPPAPCKQLVTEAWCLYSRPKPSSVWARDAMAFADQLLLPPNSPDAAKLGLPKATWALTKGPGALDDPSVVGDGNSAEQKPAESAPDGFVARLGQLFGKPKEPEEEEQEEPDDSTLQEAPIVFPLPTSEAQNRIADLLLRQHYPAIVCEGPPGTGKTHTIANMISAYLCQGKRVLVTSKSAPALAVIRERLPKCVQDLVVDVSMSELAGMRQLQQTVERLANRVSCVSTALEGEKVVMLLRNLRTLEQEKCGIDNKLSAASDRVRCVIHQPNGQKLVSGLLSLNEETPWLSETTAKWTVERLEEFRGDLASLLVHDTDVLSRVNHGCYDAAPSAELMCMVAAKAGMMLPSVKQATKRALASMPVLGQVFAPESSSAELQEQLEAMTIDGKAPESNVKWQEILQALRFEEALEKFHQSELAPLIQNEGWPFQEVYEMVGRDQKQRILRKPLLDLIDRLVSLKKLAIDLNIPEELEQACEFRALDARRGMLASQIQRLAEDLVDAKVVAELSRSFSSEAQSALIRFSQIAGKAKFSRASQPSKMTVRQRRHRQEYLDAFDRCVRYIPCWIMTSSQISDYLPAEGLFDLVVIDEASQSDITVLPGMLRGKSWLIVGDGKQVSPTESFISEESIDSLRAALPRCPLEDSLLPGQSFFDLCAQAFPRGRIVLREHFRCAPNIINFSNQQFYDGRLIPLRLPTSNERLTPSIIDVRIPDGVKVGKVNAKECDEIVRLIHAFVSDAATLCSTKPRSIGIISLLGDEQSRLIRGRLLDRIGAHKFKEHNILIGDPPTFQGAERDIVFLSMVCSPGSVPTQNRLMHAQRMNVALSRSRDRMVLVRSIDVHHVPNQEDIKLPVLEFFEEATKLNEQPLPAEEMTTSEDTKNAGGFRERAETLLKKMLKKKGFTVRDMGVVWQYGLCVEHPDTNARAALCIESCGEPRDEWDRARTQQKSIERVGWKCVRVDGLSLLVDPKSTMGIVMDFLVSAGVEASPLIYDSLEDEEAADGEPEGDAEPDNAEPQQEEAHQPQDNVDEEIAPDANDGEAGVVVISSDDENEDDERKPAACLPEAVTSENNEDAMANDQIDAAQFGQVVQNLDFLRGGQASGEPADDSSIREHVPFVNVAQRAPPRNRGRGSSSKRNREEDYLGDQSSLEGVEQVAPEETGDESSTVGKRMRPSYRRLDKYSRDGRWYPGRKREQKDEDGQQQWYDTDSDLAAGENGTDVDKDDEPAQNP